MSQGSASSPMIFPRPCTDWKSPLSSGDLCGCYIHASNGRKVLPQIDTNVHTRILSNITRTTLTQNFVNPKKDALEEVKYDFPIHDGATVVQFRCVVGDRIIKGVVKERHVAKISYEEATRRGETAALLEQSARAGDVFTASVGNVPAGAEVKVELIYLAELEHDSGTDFVAFTIPSRIAPRYDMAHILCEELDKPPSSITEGGGKMLITVDVELAECCSVRSVASLSHVISVEIGRLSTTHPSLYSKFSPNQASLTCSLESTALARDFFILVGADGLTEPSAVLEWHPDGSQRALMATLVPRFILPAAQPEVVFVCDRSGSMGEGQKMPNLIASLRLFLKSLPIGIRFNICSFGSHHDFLWPQSRPYHQATLDEAMSHVATFEANYGGTEMYNPVQDTFKKRSVWKKLEVILLTDGDVWNADEFCRMIRRSVVQSEGAIRVFTLGLGLQVSWALIKGVARAGNGFHQIASDCKKLDKKIIRMLKGALTPHVTDYALEIHYDKNLREEEGGGDDDEDFEHIGEHVEFIMDGMSIKDEMDESTNEGPTEPEPTEAPKPFFDPNVKNEDIDMPYANTDNRKEYELGELPEIVAPNYVQTPLRIPGLFPFIRTTIYVLLSKLTPRQRIRAVTLTGTANDQRFRQEIDVMELPEPGTTIHQMAARKAIQEVEENGGWMSAAKSSSGKQLKEEYEDRFDKLVQREAVKMGTEYQVAGKWCSFVALEEKDIQKETVVKEIELESPKRVESLAVYAAAPRMRMMRSMGKGGSQQSMTCSLSSSSLPAAPAAPAATAAVCMAVAPPAGALDSGEEREDVGASLFDDGPDSAQVPEAAAPDPFRIMTDLQAFDGSWKWTLELEGALGLTKQDALREAMLIRILSTNDDVLATLSVVLYLESRLPEEKDAWELMVGKAEVWLEEQTGRSMTKIKGMIAPLLLDIFRRQDDQENGK